MRKTGLQQPIIYSLLFQEICVNTNQKRNGTTVNIKVDFIAKNTNRDFRKGHFIIANGSTHIEDKI